MHAHRGSLTQRCLGQFIRNSHLIDTMTGLVDHRKHGIIYPVIICCGNTDVMVMKIGGKWMGTDSHHSLIKIKSHVFCQITSDLLLLLF